MKAMRWFSVGRLTTAALFVTKYGDWMHRSNLQPRKALPRPNEVFGPLFAYGWILALISIVVAIKLPTEEKADRIFRETNDCVALAIALFCIWFSELPRLFM